MIREIPRTQKEITMKQEDKQLLFKDLCARLPYGVIVEIITYGQEKLKPWVGKLYCKDLDCFIHDISYKSVKPYLRRKASMTNEELTIYHAFCDRKYIFEFGEVYYDTPKSLDYLNENHFDYRRLIGKGLAIEVTEENNPYK